MGDRIRRQHRFAAVPEHLIRDRDISDRAVRLWCLLDRYAGADESSFPLRKTLADDLTCSLASLDRALGELTARGWLHKERREAGGSNLYTLLVAKGGRVTGEATPPSVTSEASVVTGDATLASPKTTGVVTGDAHKEASPTGASPKDDGLRPSADTGKPSTRGTRLPDDWEPSEALRVWYREHPELHHIKPWAETERFKDHWRAAPGQRGVKIDWDATWRNWIRTAAERATGTGRRLDNVHHAPESPERAALAAAFDGAVPPPMEETRDRP